MHHLYEQQQIKNLMPQSENIASIPGRDSNILGPSISIQNTRAIPKRSHNVLRDLSNTPSEEPQQKRRVRREKAEGGGDGRGRKTDAEEIEHRRMVKALA